MRIGSVRGQMSGFPCVLATPEEQFANRILIAEEVKYSHRLRASVAIGIFWSCAHLSWYIYTSPKLALGKSINIALNEWGAHFAFRGVLRRQLFTGGTRHIPGLKGLGGVSELEDTRQLDAEMLDAALGTVNFEQLIRKLVQHFGGAGGVLFELNRKTGQIANWIGPGLEAGEQEYAEHLHSINPRMRYALSHAPGQIIYEDRFASERALDKSEFYDAIFRLSGTRYFLGSRLYDEGDVSVFHSVEFTPQHGHPDEQEVKTFKRTSENLGKAWRLSKAQRHANWPAPFQGDEAAIIHHLPWAIFAVSRDHGVTAENEHARQMAHGGGPLSLQEGHLQTSSRNTNALLVSFLEKALQGEAGSFLLVDSEGNQPLVLQSLPMPGQSRALLFIKDPRHTYEEFEQILPGLFDLSPAEVKIVRHLTQGKSQTLVAEELKLSRNTVRNHMQRIFHKTQVNTHNQLLALMLGLVDNKIDGDR